MRYRFMCSGFAKKFVLLVACFCALFVAGCAGSVKKVRGDADISSEKAYAFGRFELKVPKGFFAFQRLGIGLNFDCEGGEGFSLALVQNDPVYAIEVPSKVCSWESISYYDLGGFESSRRNVEPQWRRSLDFRAGSLHYLGDFIAGAKFTDALSYNGRAELTQWRIERVVDASELTASELMGKLPRMKKLDVVNYSLVPSAN